MGVGDGSQLQCLSFSVGVCFDFFHTAQRIPSKGPQVPGKGQGKSISESSAWKRTRKEHL